MPRLKLDPLSPSGVSPVAEVTTVKQSNGYVTNNIRGLITAGNNVTLTGSGTESNPYQIAAGDMDTAATWGNITGTLTDQTDLTTALGNYVLKSGDTMTGVLVNTVAGLPFQHNRSGAGNISWGVGSSGRFIVYENGSGAFQLQASGSGIYLGDDSKPRVLHGTGFPNGVVTAPVGSIYIDTAVTNGASSWIKKSGTGNTGWSVLEGMVSRRIPATDLLNGWTATGGANDTLWLRRYGNVVQLSSGAIVGINGTAATSNIFWTLPDGFRTSIVGNYSVIGADYNSAGVKTISKDFSNLSADRTAGTVHQFALQWITTDAWPSALPGTAL